LGPGGFPGSGEPDHQEHHHRGRVRDWLFVR
jgi:hypothetical protein